MQRSNRSVLTFRSPCPEHHPRLKLKIIGLPAIRDILICTPANPATKAVFPLVSYLKR